MLNALKRALAKDPDARFVDEAAFRQALHAEEHRPIESVRPSLASEDILELPSALLAEFDEPEDTGPLSTSHVPAVHSEPDFGMSQALNSNGEDGLAILEDLRGKFGFTEFCASHKGHVLRFVSTMFSGRGAFLDGVCMYKTGPVRAYFG